METPGAGIIRGWKRGEYGGDVGKYGGDVGEYGGVSGTRTCNRQVGWCN
jgi:hypothetical protein